jgi:hypothetical protein
MSITLPDRRALLRLVLVSIALFLGLGQAAVASEVTTPVEQLHAGLMAIMKAGKTAPFQQLYDMIAPVIGRTFDLEVILRQVIGPRLAALPSGLQHAAGLERTRALLELCRQRLQAALQGADRAAMGALLQFIGEPPDDQIATEAQRWSGVNKPTSARRAAAPGSSDRPTGQFHRGLAIS